MTEEITLFDIIRISSYSSDEKIGLLDDSRWHNILATDDSMSVRLRAKRARKNLYTVDEANKRKLEETQQGMMLEKEAQSDDFSTRVRAKARIRRLKGE
jgi:hypothetical protein